MYLYFVADCSKHYSLHPNTSSLSIMLTSVAYISYLSCCCDPIPNTKKFRKEVVYFCLQLQGIQPVMEGKIEQQERQLVTVCP